MLGRKLLVAGGAIAMGLASARLLFGGTVWNVLPWGGLALCTSLLATDRRQAWQLGGLFGFAVSCAYLWFDNTDPKTVAMLPPLLAAIVVASLFGLLCGLLLAWLGWTVRQRLRRGRV